MEFKLKDIAEFNTKSLNNKTMPSIIHYLDTSNITNGIIDEIVTLDVKHDKIPSRARRIVEMDDIIYSTVRPNQKHFGFITKELDYITVSTGFTVIKANKKYVTPYFLFCYLTTDLVTKTLQGIAENSTTAYPSIKPSDLGNLVINLPPMKIQEYISSLILNIDLKIQNNIKCLDNLEQQSQAIFKQWFIDFEFPNDEEKPYKSNGGEMKESELGEIPNTWNIKNLSHIAEIIMGQSPKSDTYNNKKIGLPLLNGATDFRNCSLSPSKFTSDAKKIGVRGDFVFGVRATIGLVTELDGTYAIGRGSGIAKSLHPEQKEYLYGVLNKAFNEFQYTASGSVYLNISKNDLLNFKICQPPFDIIKKYHQVVNSMMIQKENLKKQNQNLIQLRDILLPKLLSGEIEIPIELEV